MNSFNKVNILKNKQFWTRNSVAFVSAVAFMVSVAGPANAVVLQPYIYVSEIPNPAAVLPPQTLTVSSQAAATPVERDNFTATSMEELEARRKEEEDKKRAEEAARIEQASANSSSFTSNGGGSSSGVAPGQVIPADGIIAAAQQWVGVVPYGNGNHPSDSFACDGYVQYVFAQNGISLPRGADTQASLGTVISRGEAQAGDLVWWPGQHIGIYDGAGGMYNSPMEGRMVEHRVGSLWGSPLFIRL